MNENHKPIHQILDQARASAAWGMLDETKGRMHKDFDRYEALVKGFPAEVRRNGLGQAIALLYAKRDNKADKELLFHLTKWLTRSSWNKTIECYSPPYSDRNFEEAKDKDRFLIECIQSHSSDTYILATREALSLLDYLRRFAEGLKEPVKEKP